MKLALSLFLVVCLGSIAFFATGCSGGDDSGDAPKKADIDKGLEGQPAIDPSKSATMGSSMKKGTK